MKLITFAVPCYNAAAHMEKCIDSILPAGEESEIIIINDGSTDDTKTIADRYAGQYPDVVQVIHQKNGGHGEGVNQGMRHAKGLFFKVVDSDDSLEPKSLDKLMRTLRGCVNENALPDMVVCNYTRNKQGTGKSKLIRYANALPQERLLQWSDVGRFSRYQNLMMHAVIYKTSLLAKLDFTLPGHMYYVDCLFSHIPIYHVKTMYYIDIPLYQYLVGQPDQSISKASMLRNIDQMLRVCHMMIEYYISNEVSLHPKQEKLLLDDMALIISIASAHLVMGNTKEEAEKNQKFWKCLKARDRQLYNRMKNHPCGIFAPGKGAVARTAITLGFKVIDKIYKIN